MMAIMAAAVMVLALACIVSASASPIVSSSALADAEMPYDMAAVEEMEQFTTNAAAAQASEEDGTVSSSLPTLHDALTSSEQSFFSEDDVDSFLEQRAHAQSTAHAEAAARAKANAQAEAQQRAEAEQRTQQQAALEAQQAIEAKARAEQAVQDQQTHAADVAQQAFDSMHHAHDADQAQAAEFEAGVQSLHRADAAAEATAAAAAAAAAAAHADANVAHATDAAAEVETDADADTELDADADADVESDSDVEDDSDAETETDADSDDSASSIPSLPARSAHKSLASLAPSAFVESRSHSLSRSITSQPWWTTRQGVDSNAQHYNQGIKNSLIQAGEDGQVKNTENSYVLPMGQKTNGQRQVQGQGQGQEQGQGQGQAQVQVHPHGRLNRKKQSALMTGPVESYPLIPVQRQGPSLSFNPYSGAAFHPSIGVPQHAPTLPKYMPESTQPWAGAGYYGSGGGQGPHPGSEAYAPLPGVSGKEYGIRAREAWEAHAKKYANDAVSFNTKTLQPLYPQFPSWSRDAEMGGRPDIFPRPMQNLPTVNRLAQRAAEAEYHYSNRFYPQFNNQISVSAQDVAEARQQTGGPIAGLESQPDPRGGMQPRLMRQMVGYPRPTAPIPSHRWSGTMPSQFPRPRDSTSFDERNNYDSVPSSATLAAPYHPLAGRNIMINSGPDKGMQPMFGGQAQFIPVPVPARAQDVVA